MSPDQDSPVSWECQEEVSLMKRVALVAAAGALSYLALMSLQGLSGVAASAAPARGPSVVSFRSPGGSFPAARSSTSNATALGAASTLSPAASGAATASGPALLQGFNGLSDLTSDKLSSFAVTPPDQGLCVGSDSTLPGQPTAVWEA